MIHNRSPFANTVHDGIEHILLPVRWTGIRSCRQLNRLPHIPHTANQVLDFFLRGLYSFRFSPSAAMIPLNRPPTHLTVPPLEFPQAPPQRRPPLAVPAASSRRRTCS